MGRDLVKKVLVSRIGLIRMSPRIDEIIKDGKRYGKEYKINSTLRQNDIRGK
jgi:hypothetical protein